MQRVVYSQCSISHAHALTCETFSWRASQISPPPTTRPSRMSQTPRNENDPPEDPLTDGQSGTNAPKSFQRQWRRVVSSAGDIERNTGAFCSRNLARPMITSGIHTFGIPSITSSPALSGLQAAHSEIPPPSIYQLFINYINNPTNEPREKQVLNAVTNEVTG